MLKRGDRVKLTDKLAKMMNQPKTNSRYKIDWHQRQGVVKYVKPGLVLVRWDGRSSDDTWLRQAIVKLHPKRMSIMATDTSKITSTATALGTEIANAFKALDGTIAALDARVKALESTKPPPQADTTPPSAPTNVKGTAA